MGICRTCRAVRVLVGGLCRDCLHAVEQLAAMPKHYIDEEWDRDALFTTRNLVTHRIRRRTLEGHLRERSKRPRAASRARY